MSNSRVKIKTQRKPQTVIPNTVFKYSLGFIVTTHNAQFIDYYNINGHCIRRFIKVASKTRRRLPHLPKYQPLQPFEVASEELLGEVSDHLSQLELLSEPLYNHPLAHTVRNLVR